MYERYVNNNKCSSKNGSSIFLWSQDDKPEKINMMINYF